MFAAKLKAYLPGGAAAGELPRPIHWEASIVHNDVGALTVDYSTKAAGGALIARELEDGLEVAVEIWNGLGNWVESKGCRFVRVKQNVDQADESQVYRVTFASYGWLMMKARILEGTGTTGVRTFATPKVGPMLTTLLGENAARDGIPMSIVGGGANDANGVAWPTLPNIPFNYGLDYLSVIRGLQETGAVDWTTQARGLYAYLPDSPALSPDLSDTVRLDLGIDIIEAPADETLENLAGRVGVTSEHGGVVVVEEPTAPSPHGVWENHLAVQQASDEAAAISMGENNLETTSKAKQQYTRALVVREGAPIPMIDYWPGCWITAPTSVLAEKVRVQQVTITFGKDGYGASVVLNDRLIEADIRRGRTLGSIAGGQVGSSGPPIVTNPEASRVPSTPTSFDTVASLEFIGPTPRGVITSSWDAVTTATDSGSLDISGYEFQYRIGAGAWQTIPTPEVSATVKDFTPGDSVDSRVRAVGTHTTLPSAWSSVQTDVVPGDVTAPSVPTGLSITSALRIASLTWDGTLTDAIPADFARIEIAMGVTSTPTTVYGILTRAGTLQITGASLGIAIGATVYARARSVDSTGNASAYSAAVSVVMAGVAGPDLAANSVTANTIAVGALDGKLITGATVRTGASNPRVEMNASGLFAYNGAGVETIALLGGAATITGATIRTASGTTRLEMTTAGMIAWTSGVAVAEFLPGGLYLRQGGELVVEYPSGAEALKVGFLDTAPDIRGLEVRDLAGNIAFEVATRDASAYTTITMANLDFLTITNTTSVSVNANSSVVLSGGGATPSVLSLSGTDAVLRSANGVGIFSIPGGVFPALSAGEIKNAYDSSWRVQPHGTPTWAGGPVSSTVAILASNSAVSVAYGSTSSAANTFLTTAGTIQRVTSSLQYKQDVEDLDVTVAQVLALRPVTWRDKGEVVLDPETTHRIPGFIAEEVHEAGLTQFVVYEDGVPYSMSYDRISAAHHIVLLDHEVRLNDALARLAALEAAA